MACISRNAKLYQNRRQPTMRSTLRGPGLYINLDHNQTLTLKLKRAYPGPTPNHATTDSDNTQTVAWPFGDEYSL